LAFVLFVGFAQKGEIEDIFIPCFFLLIILVSTFFAWRKWKQLDSLKAAALPYPPLAPVAVSPKPRELREASADKYQHWLNLGKPRQVRLKFVSGFILIVFPIALISFIIMGAQFVSDLFGGSRSFSDLLGPLIFVLIISVIAISNVRTTLRDRKIMAEGNLAIAKITSQGSTGGRHPKSKIRYEFTDVSGRLIEGEGDDKSWEFYEDMEVLVFYEPGNPKINVPICGASCELKNELTIGNWNHKL